MHLRACIRDSPCNVRTAAIIEPGDRRVSATSVSESIGRRCSGHVLLTAPFTIQKGEGNA